MFLDKIINSGGKFRLATPANLAKEGSVYEKELNYLTSKGFRIRPDGLFLIK